MLKNEQLIYKMSVEQKVELLLSSKMHSNSFVGSYEFPVFDMESNPLCKAKDEYATFFPSDKALASSFNMPLVSLIYNLKGIENKASLEMPFYNVTNNPEKENISLDTYLTAKFLSSKVKGLNSCGAIVNYEQENLEKEGYEVFETLTFFKNEILKGSYFRSILVNDENELYKYKLSNQNNEISFAKATNPKQALKLIVSGCCLIYVDESILSECITYISECVYNYKRLSKEYSLKKISESTYKAELEREDVISEVIIDNACDAMMNLLNDLSNCKRTISERLKAINPTHDAKFNEFDHDNQALLAAKETIVVLKNNKVLPLRYKDRLAIIGDFAKNEELVASDFENNATTIKTAYNVFNDYDLTTVGFAYGYKENDENVEQTIEIASKLCEEADYAVVYLYAKANQDVLDENQLELINTLHSKNVKIVAVVTANQSIDMSFADKCEAIIYSYNSGQEAADAICGVLAGLDNPSAKLIDDLYEVVDDQKVVKYPFGHGINYSIFEYHNLQVNDRYLSFNITNTSDEDGYVIPQFYLIKEDSVSSLSTLQLKGFNKSFVKAHETIKVEIPFEEDTFKSYDYKSNRYFVEGGDYQIIIAESKHDVRLKGTVTLSKYYYEDDSFTNEVLETSNDLDKIVKQFANTEAKKSHISKGKGAPFGLKLTLAILVAVYFNIVTSVFLISTDTINIFDIVLIAICLLVNVLVVLFIIKSAKKRIEFLRNSPNQALSKVLAGMSEYSEVERTTYKEPVKEQEEVVEEMPVEEVSEVEEEKEIIYQNSFEDDEDTLLFKDNLTLPELCNNFHDYALSKGVSIEPSSVRTLFASIASSKIIFLDIKNKELQPKFLEILNEYFSNNGILSANENFNSLFDLIWKQEEDKYVPTEFIKAVRSAQQDNKRTSIAILDNVSMNNFYSYFNTFIEFALHPTENYEIEVNEELKITLPSNINYFLVVNEDNYLEKFSKDLAKCSVSIDLVISKYEEEQPEVEIKSISYPDLLMLISEAKENHYLEEKIWKKIDELVATINLTEKFGFGNKNILQLERFTSTLMECGGDEQEAFIAAFVSKIVPVFKTLKSYKKENGDKTLFGIIEKLFADEDLAKIQKTLIKKD